MAATASDKLKALVASDWAWQMEDSPEYATLIGSQPEEGSDGKLDDLSLAAFERREAYHLQLVKALGEIDADELGGKDEKLTYKLLLDQATAYVEGAKHRAFLSRVSNLEGPQTDFPQMMKATPVSTEAECRRYIARMKAFPEQCGQVMQLLRHGIEEGRTVPAVCLSEVETQLEALLPQNPADSPLMTPFNGTSGGAATGQGAAFELRDDALNAIRDCVQPSYQSFLDFMRTEYIPAARKDTPCSAFPDGAEMYKSLLRFHTSTELSAKEIHDAGLKEVERISADMQLILSELNFTGTMEDFIHFLRNDPQFFVSTSDELLGIYRKTVDKVYQQLPQLFEDVPDHPLEILETPSHQAPSAPAAYYFSQGCDRPGLFYVNTYQLQKRPTWHAEVLTLHEAVPGHHLQAAVAIAQQRRGALPNFRANMEDRRYGTAPSRRPFYSSYVEGWALYCEGLGKDLDLYHDPYARFGRLSMDMMRACRLVVDTGLHAFGWTRDRAVDFMACNCAQPLHEVEAEVTRYIAWPAQATAYKVGELEIRRMRADVEAAAARCSLDVDAMVRSFHDLCIAHGSVPLSLLSELVDDFIARKVSSGHAVA